ncbi:MAG TPA: DUF1638 domain-containing protein [Streptosporangiaceae bacterium]|nr:DUF1638 domain-containing protein [Streptosporangiaceae bacterium]
MSSSPTGLTSTTGSSSSCSSRGDGGGADDARGRPVAVIACGALGGHLREIAGRRGWDVEIVCLPSMLHNSPRQIAPAAERLALDLRAAGKRVVLGYADCGTYGELDGLCDRLGLTRLPGLHCYDVLAGPDRIRAALEAEPGTYLLTDFLVRSFRYSVLVPLGLDRHPELWPDYFGHYRRVVWLAQSPEPGLAGQAEEVAAMFGLPLTVLDVGTARLERELESLLTGPGAGAASREFAPAIAASAFTRAPRARS